MEVEALFAPKRKHIPWQIEFDSARFWKNQMDKPLFADKSALAQLCQRHKIRRLSLFGSLLKGTSRSDSDIDLLVQFEPGLEPGLLGLAGIEAEISDLLGGRRIDLRTAQDLSPHFREDVTSTAMDQYVA